MNMTVQCLAVEEPELTVLSLRPGVVETEMQAVIRETGEERGMTNEDMEKFKGLHSTGKLLSPDVPAQAVFQCVVRDLKDLSGQFIDYTDPRLQWVNLLYIFFCEYTLVPFMIWSRTV